MAVTNRSTTIRPSPAPARCAVVVWWTADDGECVNRASRPSVIAAVDDANHHFVVGLDHGDLDGSSGRRIADGVLQEIPHRMLDEGRVGGSGHHVAEPDEHDTMVGEQRPFAPDQVTHESADVDRFAVWGEPGAGRLLDEQETLDEPVEPSCFGEQIVGHRSSTPWIEAVRGEDARGGRRWS